MRAARHLALGLALGLAGCHAEPGAEAPATAPANTLKWTAGSEDRVFGYLVYRSDRREGPFLRKNGSIVRVPEDDAETHEYTWVDRDVEAGKTYFYYLDVVSEAGVKRRFSGISSRTPPR